MNKDNSLTPSDQQETLEQTHERVCRESWDREQKLISERDAALARLAAVEAERDALRVAFSEASHNAGPAFVAHEELAKLKSKNETLKEELRICRDADYAISMLQCLNGAEEQRDAARAQVAKLEADAAALRAALGRVKEWHGINAYLSKLATDALATDAGASLLARLQAVEDALYRYHHALDTRQHGGTAQAILVGALEVLFNAPWIQGATLASMSPQPEDGR